MTLTNCKTSFEKHGYQQVYCSKKCRREWWAKEDKKYPENARGRQRKYNKTEKSKIRTRRFNWTVKGLLSRTIGRTQRINCACDLDLEYFLKWYEEQGKKCFYCGVSEADMNKLNMNFNKRVKRLSIDRLDHTKGYVKGNIVLACYRCNSIKGDFFTKEEMLKLAEQFIKPKLCLK